MKINLDLKEWERIIEAIDSSNISYINFPELNLLRQQFLVKKELIKQFNNPQTGNLKPGDVDLFEQTKHL